MCFHFLHLLVPIYSVLTLHESNFQFLDKKLYKEMDHLNLRDNDILGTAIISNGLQADHIVMKEFKQKVRSHFDELCN